MDSLIDCQTPGMFQLLEEQPPRSPLDPAGLAWPDPRLEALGEANLMAVSAAESSSGDMVAANTLTTYSVASGDAVTGYVFSANDSDWYKITLTAGVTYTFSLNKIDASGLDCYLSLRSSSGTQIALNDDSNGTLNSQIIYKASTSGTHFLAASSYAGVTFGQYSLSVSTPTGGYNATSGYGEASVERAIEKLLAISIPNLPNQFSGGLYGLDRIGAPEVWSAGYTGSGVVVAVVDTGVDRNHPDLSSSIWSNPKEIAGNGKDDDGNNFIDDVYGWNFFSGTNDTLDDNNHGTHVSGTIAAARNSIGITGVAYGAKIMPVKVLDASGSGSYDTVAKGIRYAADNGAHVINLSLGGNQTLGLDALQSAVAYAWNKGVAVIMAAGNNGAPSPFYPAAYATATGMAIGAVDSTGALASFSNKAGSTVLDYVTAGGLNVYSTLRNNTYGTLSGTSMATPQVAGAMALLIEANRRNFKGQSLAQLETLFTSTASNMPTGTATATTTTTTTNTTTATTTTIPTRSSSSSSTHPGASPDASRDEPAIATPVAAPMTLPSVQDRSNPAEDSSSPFSSSNVPVSQGPTSQPEHGTPPQPALDALYPMAAGGSEAMDSDVITGWLPWPWLVARR